MKTFMTASVALAALVSSAHAQDGGYNWNGSYLGVEIGSGLSSTDFDASSTAFAGGYQEDALIGGVFVGHDWQFGNIVYGLVADIDFVGSADLAFGDSDALTGGKGEAYTYDTDWVASARARLGFTPTDRLLVYGTGGMAVADFRATSYDYPSGGSSSSAAYSDVKLGGVFGLGVDYALPNDWTLKVEYLHYEFETISFGGAGVPNSIFSPKLDAVKFGLAYRF